MGLLGVPKGLISWLPMVGSSDGPKDDAGAREEPVDEAPDTASEDEPDTVDTPGDEGAEGDDPDEPDQEDTPAAASDSEDAETDTDSADDSEESESTDSDSADDSEDISDVTAPSVGPNTKIEKEDPEERLARHEQSDTDAMGLDKRREVIGGNYSASFGKQLIRWAVVVLVIAGAAFGAKLLVDDLDKPPAKAVDEAPWAGNHEEPAALE